MIVTLKGRNGQSEGILKTEEQQSYLLEKATWTDETKPTVSSRQASRPLL